METDVTLTPMDFAVYKRVPLEFEDENFCGGEIALARTSGEVLRRISRMVAVGLIQRRHAETGPARSEIRRLGR